MENGTGQPQPGPPISDSNPNQNNKLRPKSVMTKVLEVEVHLYRTRKSVIDVFKLSWWLGTG
ncbi:hypothetical protein G4B88_020215 [Cannabis sativa]|uniref:Uncharacterized protein n=1 Tax=Cannabis sativa TaxID=3483 RepID=A0A7J6GU15_CANSA|nr:hypothetical protein G4B88_020215 [Cannabis sativa]